MYDIIIENVNVRIVFCTHNTKKNKILQQNSEMRHNKITSALHGQLLQPFRVNFAKPAIYSSLAFAAGELPAFGFAAGELPPLFFVLSSVDAAFMVEVCAKMARNKAGLLSTDFADTRMVLMSETVKSFHIVPSFTSSSRFALDIPVTPIVVSSLRITSHVADVVTFISFLLFFCCEIGGGYKLIFCDISSCVYIC